MASGRAQRFMRLSIFVVLLLVGGFTTHVVYRALWLPSPMSWPEKFSSKRWKAAAEDKRFVFWKDLSRRRLIEGRTLNAIYFLRVHLDERDVVTLVSVGAD